MSQIGLIRLQSLLGIAFVAFAATAGTSAAQDNPPDDVRAMAKKVMMPVVLKVPGMDRVKVFENLKYTKSDDPNVLMDIYVPPDLSENEKRPAVIFLHGGAKTDYTPKDWGVYTSWGRLIAASGFVGVTFTHRLEYPNASLEKAAADVRDAIKYVRENADKYHVDKDRVCLIAYSAGGPLLTLAMRGDMSFVRCLVGFYAFMDIQQSGLPKDREAGDGEIFFSDYLSPNRCEQNPANVHRSRRPR
jgi:acetyl esterase/lipase